MLTLLDWCSVVELGGGASKFGDGRRRPRDTVSVVYLEKMLLSAQFHTNPLIVGNYLVAFLVFPFFFFFCRGVSVISDPKGGSWNFLLRNRGKLVSERRSPKRFLEDGESDIDADVERCGM